MRLSRSILVLTFAAFPVISWASTGPHPDHSPDSPLPPCSQSPDNGDAGGSRHSHYYLCELSNGAQALAADSTPPRIDAQHPFHVDWAHYPEESKIKREEGWCVVSFKVGKDGRIEHDSIRLERSSQSVSLDFQCLRAFSDGELLPATQHGRPLSQRVGAVGVWTIDGPIPLRPKEDQVVSLCTKDSSILPSSMIPPVNGQSFLTAGKLATDKGWLLDPCFYRDEALKQFFGATKIDRFFDHAHGHDQGRWEGINLVVPGSAFGRSGPEVLVPGLTLVFSPAGIQRAELRINNINQVMPPAVRDDVVRVYGVGEIGLEEMTDGGPSFETLAYNSVEGEVHTRSFFEFNETKVSDTIITVEQMSTATIDSKAAAPVNIQPPPAPLLHLRIQPPPGDLKYIVTDLAVFDDEASSDYYTSLLPKRMHALECCATDIPKLFSGYRLQVRGYDLTGWLPPADRDVLNKLGDTVNAPVRAVNRRNQVVGVFSPEKSDDAHGFLLDGGMLTAIGTLGGKTSEADAINNCGQVAGGAAVLFDSPEHAFVYERGVMKDLGPGHVNAINDSGQAAGLSRLDGQKAALWSRGKRTVLGEELSEAFGINSAGAVVGEYYDHEDSDQPHAFLYQNGKRIDLQDYLVQPRRPGLSALDTTAVGINDDGQITVYERNATPRSQGGGDDFITYLLTPVAGRSLEIAMRSITSAERQLWLGRCNSLADFRHIQSDDRPRFLVSCTESAALPYLKHDEIESRSRPTTCLSIKDIVPTKVEGAEIPYSVRIPVSADRFIRELSKLATVSQSADAAHQLGRALHATLRKHKSDDLVFYKLETAANWNAELRLSSNPSGGWTISAGDRFGHNQLIFIKSGKPQCLHIDLVDRVLTESGFKRSNVDIPLAGPLIRWELNRNGASLVIGGFPEDQCIPALIVRSIWNVRVGSAGP
jgi:TonB family protein